MIHELHNLVWGPALILLLLAVGGYYTWKSGVFQIRGFRQGWSATAGSLKEKKSPDDGQDVPVFTKTKTACTALAATIGTGNIAGVATALAAGGPGAVFWMWVSGLLGMMTAYAEVSLGTRFRQRRPDGSWFGGPCAYLADGLRMPRLALVYGVLCLFASLGMGSMVQSNAVAQTFGPVLRLPPPAGAVLVTALVLGIVLGGTKRIAGVTAWLIPLAAVIYGAGSVTVLAVCRERIPQVLGEIIRGALLPQAVLGGTGGYGVLCAFRYGIARGVFSNEAGLGTLAGLHGAAEDTTPREQGMWAMFEVFLDTMVICTMTALVILCALGGEKGLAGAGRDGAAMAGMCFGRVLGPAGEYLTSAAMAVFAFSTMIAWYFLGKQTLNAAADLAGRLRRKRRKETGRTPAAVRLCPPGGWRRTAGTVYLCLYAYAVFLGGVSSLTAVWELSDVFNGLMAFPNLLALVLLRRDVFRE